MCLTCAVCEYARVPVEPTTPFWRHNRFCPLPTSAPGPGWLAPSHICPATALIPSHICTGTGLTPSQICAGIDVQAAGISCKVVLGVDGIAWAADGCEFITRRVPSEYPASTPRVPREYPASTPRVPRRLGGRVRAAAGRSDAPPGAQ